MMLLFTVKIGQVKEDGQQNSSVSTELVVAAGLANESRQLVMSMSGLILTGVSSELALLPAHGRELSVVVSASHGGIAKSGAASTADRADGGLAEMSTQPPTSLNELVQVEASLDAHSVQHVDNILGGHIARGTGSIGAPTEATHTSVNRGDPKPKSDKNVGQGLTISVVEVDSEMLGGNELGHLIEKGSSGAGRANTSSVAEHNLIAAQVVEAASDLSHLDGVDRAIVGISKNGRDAATDTHAISVSTSDYRLEALNAFLDAAVDIFASKSFPSGSEDENFLGPVLKGSLVALEIGNEDAVGNTGTRVLHHDSLEDLRRVCHLREMSNSGMGCKSGVNT